MAVRRIGHNPPEAGNGNQFTFINPMIATTRQITMIPRLYYALFSKTFSLPPFSNRGYYISGDKVFLKCGF